jgi:hypothetical protein
MFVFFAILEFLLSVTRTFRSNPHRVLIPSSCLGFGAQSQFPVGPTLGTRPRSPPRCGFPDLFVADS